MPDPLLPLRCVVSAARPVDKFTWQQKVIRHAGVSATAHHVGLTLSVYADADGSNARPGVDNLARECGVGPRTILRALDELRRALLIDRTYERRQAGRRGWADVYQLTMPETLASRDHPLTRSGLYGPATTTRTGDTHD